MKDFFKKDSYVLGVALASIAPVILYYVLTFVVDWFSDAFTGGIPMIQNHNVILVSVFLNMIIFSKFIHKSQYDKTGRGVMLITFVFTAIYFVWRFKNFLD